MDDKHKLTFVTEISQNTRKPQIDHNAFDRLSIKVMEREWLMI